MLDIFETSMLRLRCNYMLLKFKKQFNLITKILLKFEIIFKYK